MIARPKPPKLSEEWAATVALQVLAYLLGDERQISRFLSLTGSTPEDLRGIADSRELQTATLEYLLSDEGLLLSFCQGANIDPATIAPAYQLLAGHIED
jgi:hypothetical protein